MKVSVSRVLPQIRIISSKIINLMRRNLNKKRTVLTKIIYFHIQRLKLKNFTINLINIQEINKTVQIRKNKVHKVQQNKVNKNLQIV